MDTEKLDRHIKSKSGVTARISDGCTRYLLNDKMFAMLQTFHNADPIVSLKSESVKTEFYRSEYPDSILPSERLEPLHWNDFMLCGNISDEIVLQAVDESYDIIFAGLSPHAKKALDPNEPSYKYVLKNFDLDKVMRERIEENE